MSLWLDNSGRAAEDDSSGSAKSPIYRALLPQFSTDTQIVNVHFGDAFYGIPRNYLIGVTQPKGQDAYAAFTIQVLLPDLAPRTLENAAQLDRVGWHDQLRALFEFGRHMRPAEEIVDQYLQWGHLSRDDYKIVGGLHFYSGNMTVTHELYTKNTSNGVFYITCKGAAEVPSPSCSVAEELGDTVQVRYSYSRSYLQEAYHIDASLRALIGSWRHKD